MRDMSQSGVGVGAMSHKHEGYESEWSKCGKRKRVRANRNTHHKFLMQGMIEWTRSGDESDVIMGRETMQVMSFLLLVSLGMVIKQRQIPNTMVLSGSML